METSRSLFEKASLALVALALLGCGLPEEADQAGTEQVTSALVIPTLMDFSKNTPSVLRPGGSSAKDKVLTQRVGYGTHADEIMSLTGRRLDTVNLAPSSARKAQSRPVSSWLASADFFSSIYLPLTTSDRFQDTTGGPPGPAVFPALTTCPGGGTPCMLGAASTSLLQKADFLDANTFAVALDNSNADPNKQFYRLRQSARPFGVWQDVKVPFLVGATEYFPTSTPVLVAHAAGGPIPGCAAATPSDSVWFACTPASQPQLCELRLTPGGNQFYKATIGNTTSVFAPNTRPTAIANVSSGASADRWLFAVTSETSSGTIVLRAKRETSCPDSTTPTWDFDDVVATSGPNANTYSTPMPYIRADGKTAITFFRYVPGFSTEVWEATYAAASGWVQTRIHTIGRVIPPGNEPTGTDVSHTHNLPAGQDSDNSIYFRLPHPTAAGQVRDTIRLIQEPAGKYAAMMVKPAFDESKLFVVQESANKLFEIDMATGARSQLGTASWTGTSAFATDGIGLGYAVVNGTLWEVNLNSGDGQRRQIGTTNAFAGTTHLAYGFDSAVSTVPRLWAARSNNLYMVQLSDGAQTRLPGQPVGWWNAVKAMTTATDFNQPGHATKMFMVNGSSLYQVDHLSGTVALLGNAGDWPNVTAMTANTSLQRLFIADGSDTSNMRVYRVTYSGDWKHGYSGLFSNAQFMTTRNGVSYVMKSRKIHRINSTQDTHGQTITLTGLGSLWEDYTEKGMAATSW